MLAGAVVGYLGWFLMLLCWRVVQPGNVKTIPMGGLNLWIDSKEIESLIGLNMDIFVIREGQVVHYLREIYLEQNLPILPPEIKGVKLSWQANDGVYRYTFTDVRSLDPHILYDPVLGIPTEGYISRNREDFELEIPCTGHETGTAAIFIALEVNNRYDKPIVGSPIRLQLRKRCLSIESSYECRHDCLNGGVCGDRGHCNCTPGYTGNRCQYAVCSPSCQNNGTCSQPQTCVCQPGYIGDNCEEATCTVPCQNGGVCRHPDRCECPDEYYGIYCHYTTGVCSIPCKNGGTCGLDNICICPHGYTGKFCQTPLCRRWCGVHGRCVDVDVCDCYRGWRGRHCHKTIKRVSNKHRKRERRKKLRKLGGRRQESSETLHRPSRSHGDVDPTEASEIKPRRRRLRSGHQRSRKRRRRDRRRRKETRGKSHEVTVVADNARVRASTQRTLVSDT